MQLLRPCLTLLVCLSFCLSPVALAQDKNKDSSTGKGQDAKKDDMKKEDKGKEGSARVRGFLPANYRKLGLSEEQRQKVYKVQAEYDDKIKDLEEQIAEMKAKRSKAVESVLTEAQKARLKEITSGKDKDK